MPLTLKQQAQAFLRWRKAQGGAVALKKREPWRKWWKQKAPEMTHGGFLSCLRMDQSMYR
jgi:hypothetical protein